MRLRLGRRWRRRPWEQVLPDPALLAEAEVWVDARINELRAMSYSELSVLGRRLDDLGDVEHVTLRSVHSGETFCREAEIYCDDPLFARVDVMGVMQPDGSMTSVASGGFKLYRDGTIESWQWPGAS